MYFETTFTFSPSLLFEPDILSVFSCSTGGTGLVRHGGVLFFACRFCERDLQVESHLMDEEMPSRGEATYLQSYARVGVVLARKLRF